MYNIAEPTVNSLGDYDRVSSHRSPATRHRLNALRPTISVAYDSYAASRPRVRGLAPLALTPSDKRILRENFSRMDRGQPCDDIRMELLQSTQAGQCPYCRLSDATSLDHILEKSRYPEFSINRSNLAPCCLDCNTAKQHNARHVAGGEVFHLYYYGFPAADFLELEIDVSASAVRFTFGLKRPAGISNEWFEALENHFVSANLANRYARRSRVEMHDRKREMQRLHGIAGPSEVSEFLRRLADSVAINWSAQDWLYVLLAEASASYDFCDQGVFLV